MRRITAWCWLSAGLVLAACQGAGGPGVVIGECKDVQQYFQECGGNPGGSWIVHDYCVEPAQRGLTPWEDRCNRSDVVADVHLEYHGSATFDATRVSFSETETTYRGTVQARKQCVQDAGAYACRELADLWFWYMNKANVDCRALGAHDCECIFYHKQIAPATTYDYSVEAGIMHIKDAFGNRFDYPYCVGGDHRMAWSLKQIGIVGGYMIFHRN